jgi:hypothetical protein
MLQFTRKQLLKLKLTIHHHYGNVLVCCLVCLCVKTCRTCQRLLYLMAENMATAMMSVCGCQCQEVDL